MEEDKTEIDFSEFLDLMTQRVSNKDTREDLKKVFNFFDLDKTGYISIKNLKAIVKELGENIDEQELQEMIQKADQDQDGQVSEEEFYNIMTRKGARVWNIRQKDTHSPIKLNFNIVNYQSIRVTLNLRPRVYASAPPTTSPITGKVRASSMHSFWADFLPERS